MTKMRTAKSKTTRTRDKTRDAWLREVGAGMSSWFVDLGFPLSAFEVRTGFPSAGARSPDITESWIQDDGGSYVIFVRPDRDDAFEVAAALAYQLCRVAVEQRDSHGYLFRHLAISIGLKGTKSESPPKALFKELAKPLLEKAGPLPVSDISSTGADAKPRQTTRMVKVACTECGYLARVSRKWLTEVGPPLCPLHGPMKPSD